MVSASMWGSIALEAYGNGGSVWAMSVTPELKWLLCVENATKFETDIAVSIHPLRFNSVRKLVSLASGLCVFGQLQRARLNRFCHVVLNRSLQAMRKNAKVLYAFTEFLHFLTFLLFPKKSWQAFSFHRNSER